MDKYTLLAVMITVAITLADEWGHRDELAARRFRELNPATVESDLDQSRNRRWHRVGFRQRLETTTLAAGIVLVATGSWLAFGLAAVLMGAIVSLVFDISFNVRLGLCWWYSGTTAWLDQWLSSRSLEAGKVVAALELAMVVASGAAWLIFI